VRAERWDTAKREKRERNLPSFTSKKKKKLRLQLGGAPIFGQDRSEKNENKSGRPAAHEKKRAPDSSDGKREKKGKVIIGLSGKGGEGLRHHLLAVKKKQEL